VTEATKLDEVSPDILLKTADQDLGRLCIVSQIPK
jgi:hypothetical protein